ncbi:hypothetical protein [Muricoccus pecuniae]|uniref:Uncharacterized protein n=1 Tax=Muricoccus pecuniae TaxID=693023 RepID=A0A840YH80_9PROT|nr:hypothetical protein [Roseomonas pecuniae]MBB5695711.1 hypothetical protein [Roseomonas pecuniae]
MASGTKPNKRSTEPQEDRRKRPASASAPNLDGATEVAGIESGAVGLGPHPSEKTDLRQDDLHADEPSTAAPAVELGDLIGAPPSARSAEVAPVTFPLRLTYDGPTPAASPAEPASADSTPAAKIEEVSAAGDGVGQTREALPTALSGENQAQQPSASTNSADLDRQHGVADAARATVEQKVVPVNIARRTEGTAGTGGGAESRLTDLLAPEASTGGHSSDKIGPDSALDANIDRDEDLPDRDEEETVELLDTLPVPMQVTTVCVPGARAAGGLYEELWKVIGECQQLHRGHTIQSYRAEWQQVAVAAIAGQNNGDFKVVQRIIERRGLNLNKSANQDWLFRAYAAREDWDNRRPGDRAKASVWAQATKNLVEIMRIEAAEARDGRLFTARGADVREVMRLIKEIGGIKKLKDWQPLDEGDTEKKKGGGRKLKIVLDPEAVASERERRANAGLGAEDTATLIISGPDGREKLRLDGDALPASTRKELANRQPGNPEIEALGTAFALGAACVIPEGKEARRHRIIRGASIVITTTNMAASVVVKFRPTPDIAELLLIGKRWFEAVLSWSVLTAR